MHEITIYGPEDAEKVVRPSREAVEAAVRGLDGIERTLVFLQTDDEGSQFGIGGGGVGYIVYHTIDNLEFWNLLAPGVSSGMTEMTCGGQTAEFPTRQVVSLEAALSAAWWFMDSGGRDPGLIWEQQLPDKAPHS